MVSDPYRFVARELSPDPGRNGMFKTEYEIAEAPRHHQAAARVPGLLSAAEGGPEVTEVGVAHLVVRIGLDQQDPTPFFHGDDLAFDVGRGGGRAVGGLPQTPGCERVSR